MVGARAGFRAGMQQLSLGFSGLRGRTAARGLSPVVPVVQNQFRLPFSAHPRGSARVSGMTITVCIEPVTDCNLPLGKAR